MKIQKKTKSRWRGFRPFAAALICVTASLSLFLWHAHRVHASTNSRPNVVVILLDDVGFGAIGAFGGPVHTPNFDALAANGLRYNNFHTTALCSPTRAALLSGRNHHSVGMATITETASNYPGYNGHIPKSAALLPRMLKDSGYATYGLGKWHLTPVVDITTMGPYDYWPTSQGFDHFYGFLPADTDQYSPALWDDTKPVEAPKDPNYHLTIDLADHAISWLKAQRQKSPDQPLFLYFAPGATHAPHQVPADYIARYKGRFDQGWDKVREETLARQKKMGVVPANTVLSPRASAIPEWNTLSDDQKALYAHMEEVYAGFLEHTDFQVGRVLDTLKSLGIADNTIVILTSDNGASGEGGLEGSVNEMRVGNMVPEDLNLNLKNMDKLGSPSTYNHYPAGWALAMNAPCKYWKQFTHEGGIRDPFIIAWPGHLNDKGAIRGQFMHVVDIVPTLLRLAGVKPAAVVDGVTQKPIEGVDQSATLFDAKAPSAKKVQYFEMLGNRAIWADGWKAVAWHGRLPWQTGPMSLPPFDQDKWELYDTSNDFSELNDLAAQNPAKLAQLEALFDQEAKKYQVYPLDGSGLSERIANLQSQITHGRVDYSYQGVQMRLPDMLSPPVKNRSFTIDAEVEVPASGCQGVVVEDGGRFAGYSFYCKDGILKYAHNFVGETVYTVASTSKVPSGKVALRLEFDKTGVTHGIASGVAKLFVNGKKVGEGPIDRTDPIVYSLADGFDVGMATGTAVTDDYETPNAFTGKIDKVVFHLAKDQGTLGPPPVDD